MIEARLAASLGRSPLDRRPHGALRGRELPQRRARGPRLSAIDANVYGFVLTELNLPMESGEQADEFVAEMALSLDRYPHLAEMMTEQVLDKS